LLGEEGFGKGGDKKRKLCSSWGTEKGQDGKEGETSNYRHHDVTKVEKNANWCQGEKGQ